ncbi:FAD/NAD(P)-binding domain-containing protein [Choiromyces venosus 120613-1]|uniref:FAD/NAD(P)-binding domain-containing protein n=1 Tax=Choiromyces venosus 120613-1 TaxID=1336337 RepID=A0A3N4JDB2_9PEZI|nr:FAD/NAD(P)-binding domain-containing protein [Choiromyces venosus 120613-1]
MSRPFKVVIVGGGIGGLALALTLAKAGIDYVLLEAHSEISPVAGASIAIFPAGAKTLDQIGGVLDDLRTISSPIHTSYARDDKGKLICIIALVDLVFFLVIRSGYPAGFLPRQELLALLYKHVPDKSKVLLGKRVVKVVHSDTGVRVITKDGDEFAGDIVVGADGVHSIIRQEMWALADELSPGLITEKEKKDTLSAEYCSVVGIATPHPGLEEDCAHVIHNHGRSSIIISGYGGRVFWFLFEKLDKIYKVPNIPELTNEDGKRLAEQRLGDMVTENIKFKELWDKTTTYVTVPLEEGCFEHWHYGRMIVIGDAVHKVTINLGLGANSAIESAAALTNGLYHAVKAHPEGLSTEMIDKIFADVQAHRKDSVESLFKATAESTRMQAWATTMLKLTSKYFIQHLIGEDYIWNLQEYVQRRTERLDFLPDSDKGAIPMIYSPRYPNERAKLITGIAYVLPAIGLLGYYFGVCTSTLMPAEVNEKIRSAAAETGIPSFGIYSSARFGLAKIFTSSFSNLSDSLTDDKQSNYRLKIVTAQAVLGLFPILTIMVVESLRRGNTLTLPKIPTFWGFMYQIFPISIVLPIYFFFHAYQITPAKYYEKNFISIPMAHAKSLIPTLVISFLIPTTIMLVRGPSLKESMALWLPFPIYTSILHQILRSFFTTPALVKKNADLPYIRGAYLLSFAVSASAHIYALCTSSMTGDSVLALVSRLTSGAPPTNGNSFVEVAVNIVCSEYLIAFSAALVWVLVLLNDVKRFRMTAAGWLELLGYIIAASAVFGPAATVLAAYAWREELLRV